LLLAKILIYPELLISIQLAHRLICSIRRQYCRIR